MANYSRIWESVTTNPLFCLVKPETLSLQRAKGTHNDKSGDISWIGKFVSISKTCNYYHMQGIRQSSIFNSISFDGVVIAAQCTPTFWRSIELPPGGLVLRLLHSEKISIDLSRVWTREPRISRRERYPENTEADNHRMKIHKTLRSKLTTILIGHGRLKAHYHRFKIIEDPTRTCGGGS